MLSLKSTLLLNGVSSGATGMGLILFAKKVAELFGAQSTVAFIETGVFFVAFATLVLYTALQKEIKVSLVKAITWIDISWVCFSIVIVANTWGAITFLGSAATIAVAGWVSIMAYLQNRGVKLLRMAETSSNIGRNSTHILHGKWISSNSSTSKC
jgi:hypothetical protein